MAITKTRQNSQEISSITKNNITILNDQEVQLNNITLISRKDYTNKKPKEYNLTTKTYNIVLDHQPQGIRENIKNNVDLNSAAILITVKCFHSLILTIYNPTLRAITKKNIQALHKIISSGLVGWCFPIRTEGICEYVVVNIKQDK